MPLYLSEADVECLLRPAEVTDALELIFRELASGQTRQQPRQRVSHGAHVLHQLEAISAGLGLASSKVYLSGPGGVRFLTLLFQLSDSSLVAIVESARLGQLRTGCATALAARSLARPPVGKLAVLGAGTVARGQYEALVTECEPARTAVWSRKPESRAEFVAWAQGPVEDCSSVEQAVEGADLVVVATSSSRPVLLGSMLGPAGLVCGVGVNWANRREMDDEAVRRCDWWVLDSREQALLEAGDLLQTPNFDWSKTVELAGVGERPPGAWVGFKSVGVACEDLAAASLAYRLALQQNLGVRF